MKYDLFLAVLLSYRKMDRTLDWLNSEAGVNLYDGPRGISDDLGFLIESVFTAFYTKEGYDWISWFIFENEWGEKDWGFEVDDITPKYGATEADGTPIAYSLQSLYTLLEKDYRKTVEE